MYICIYICIYVYISYIYVFMVHGSVPTTMYNVIRTYACCHMLVGVQD